jgi:hypothetical protein
MNMKYRVTAIILCITLVFVTLPTQTAHADNDGSGGMGGTSGVVVVISDNIGGSLIGGGSKALFYGGSAFMGGSGAGFLWATAGYDAANSVSDLMQPGTGTVGNRIDRALAVIDLSMSVYAIGAGIVAAAGMATIGSALVAAVTATGTAYLVAKIMIAMGRQVAADIDVILGSLPDPNEGDLDVRKPNIYLYCDYDVDVNVQLEPYEYITCSIPIYDKYTGWDAKVYSGSINGSNDYLFYEASVPDSGFQKEWGFVVNNAAMEEDMLRILNMYGFNETEKRDFIEYWAVELPKGHDWIFYPQETSIVDGIMPVFVHPEPDNIYRIWFYIEPYSGQKLLYKNSEDVISHEGYTLVEWGGMVKFP